MQSSIYNLRKALVLILSITLSLYPYVGAAECSPHPTNSTNSNKVTSKKLMQQYANDILHYYGPLSKQLTAVSMAAQCGNNKPVYIYAGTNGFNDNTAINKNSLFQVGSITKSFISVIILQLTEEHKFSIDSNKTLAKYFPEYPKWSNITLRQLMNMTSGIPGYGSPAANDIIRMFTADQFWKHISQKEILDKVYALPMSFKPGKGYEYSNTNYVLLGMLIERITHQTYQQQVKTKIFDKLGLKHTYFPVDSLVNSYPKINKSQIVRGYAFCPKGVKPYKYLKCGDDISNASLSWLNSAGAIVSTPSDINNYVGALYTPNILLTKKQINDLTTFVSMLNGKPLSSNEDEGYGLGVEGQYGYYLYEGTTYGFRMIYFYNPKNALRLTVAVNSMADLNVHFNAFVLFNKLNGICGKP